MHVDPPFDAMDISLEGGSNPSFRSNFDSSTMHASHSDLCPICLSDVLSTGQGPIFRRRCGHVAHWRCIRTHVPFSCPICRQHWHTDADFESARLCIASDSNDAASPPPPRHRVGHGNTVPSPLRAPTLAPVDVMFMCCLRIGPPPDFLELPHDSSMSYSPNFIDGAWGDAWYCYSCDTEVDRTVIQFASPTRICYRHGVCAMAFQNTPIGFSRLPDACVQQGGIELHMIPCDEQLHVAGAAVSSGGAGASSSSVVGAGASSSSVVQEGAGASSSVVQEGAASSSVVQGAAASRRGHTVHRQGPYGAITFGVFRRASDLIHAPPPGSPPGFSAYWAGIRRSDFSSPEGSSVVQEGAASSSSVVLGAAASSVVKEGAASSSVVLGATASSVVQEGAASSSVVQGAGASSVVEGAGASSVVQEGAASVWDSEEEDLSMLHEYDYLAHLVAMHDDEDIHEMNEIINGCD